MKSKDGKNEKRKLEEKIKKQKKTKKSKTRKSEKDRKEDAGARKGRKVAKHHVAAMISGSGHRQVVCLKRRVQNHLLGIVARSTCRSQSTLYSEHFWKVTPC